MEMPGRKWQGTNDKFRYSHNDQEREEEIFSGANSAEYWMYDSRIGRRWELDPLAYEWQSPYATFNNNPVYFADPLGLEGGPPLDEWNCPIPVGQQLGNFLTPLQVVYTLYRLLDQGSRGFVIRSRTSQASVQFI